MQEYLSRLDKAIVSIESFLELDNSPFIVLFLYRSDKIKLERLYPTLKFKLFDKVVTPRKLNKYIIEK